MGVIPKALRRRNRISFALTLALLSAGLSAPAHADWTSNFNIGQQAMKNGPFGGVVAGFFNAVTGGAIFGKGAPSAQAPSGRAGEIPAAQPASDDGKKNPFFPPKSDITPEVAQAKLERKLPADINEIATGMGSLSMLQQDQQAANPGVSYGGPRAQQQGEAVDVPSQAAVPAVTGREVSQEELLADQARLQDASRRRVPPRAQERSRPPSPAQTSAADKRVHVPNMPKADGLRSQSKGFYDLGVRSIFMQDYKSAIKNLEQAIKLDPTNADNYEGLAWAQLKSGRFADALNSAEMAVLLNPASAQAHYLKACALEKLGRKSESLAEMERAAGLDPSRFWEVLEGARRGRRIFEPESDDSWQLMEAVTKRRVKIWLALEWTLLWLGAAGLAGGGFFFLRRRLKSASAEARWAQTEIRIASKQEPASAEGVGVRLAGKYELTRVIGRGGMGQVWEGKDVPLARTVAIKKLMFEEGEIGAKARELCLSEARTLAALHHPNIVEIYDIIDHPTGLYLAFEFLAGKTVQHLLAEQKRLTLKRSQEILRPVCDALKFAHASSIVHRDLKPANIMVTQQGFIKLMDFGIARRIQASAPDASAASAAAGQGKASLAGLPMARTQTVAGTPAYMAPEAETGIVSPALDVYSLGACLYEMLTGAQPFGLAGKLSRKIGAAYVKAAAAVPGLPPEVDALLSRALDPVLETRMKSVAEFRDALDAIKADAQA